MHYYQHNIGDYRRDTGHLSLLEHGVYRQLLDMYYLSESPIPRETQQVFRRLSARTQEEQNAVEIILNEFFLLTEEGWKHKRCDVEIERINQLKKFHWTSKLTKEQKAEIQARRRANKLNATPWWLTKEHKSQIATIYMESALITAETGIKHEVDHIVPLCNKDVCGLHAPWNLQIIPAYKNRKKSNSLESC